MYNLYLSLPTFLFSIFCYFYSLKSFKNNQQNLALILIILGGLILRIYSASDLFLHSWDERYHALVAKNLLQHPLLPTLYEHPVLDYNYQNWTSNHIWVHKQPFSLWMMSLSLHLFGINEWALRIPSILFSTATIWLTYSIGKYFYDSKTGLLAAFFCSINGLIIELTGGKIATDHVDICFLFLIALAIYCSIRFAETPKMVLNFSVGVCIAAAILTKWLPALIVLPIWFLLVWSEKKLKFTQIIFHFLFLLLVIAALVFPWQYYIFQQFPKEAAWEYSFNVRHFTEVLDGMSGSYFYFVNQIRINYGDIIYIPLIWFILKQQDSLKNSAISIWIFIPLVFFSLAKTKMQGYILFIAPALFIVTAYFYFEFKNQNYAFLHPFLKKFISLLLLILPIRYSIERLKPFELDNKNPQWAIDLKNLKTNTNENTILFNCESPIEAMFYTNLTAYPQLPDQKLIDTLISKGKNIIINDKGDVSNEIKSLNNVQFIHLSSPNPK